jgi:hypothetical protein
VELLVDVHRSAAHFRMKHLDAALVAEMGPHRSYARILAEGAMTLPVTLSGGVLFAS